MTIQHTVAFRLSHPEGSAAEADFLDTARATLGGIPGISGFRINRQVSAKSPLRFQFTMDFADQAAYDAYNAHPDHRGFVASRWLSEVAEFQELDFVELV